MFKVGISNHVFDRVRSLKLTTPHSFSVECVYRHESGAVAKICEKLIHEHFDKEGYVGFNGSSEWLTCNENNWVDVIQHITTMFGMEKFRYE